MKKLVLSFMMLTLSVAAMASEYIYSCNSSKNQKIFLGGQSQNIAVEISSDILFINNYSKIWNSLILDDEVRGHLTYRSFSTGTTYSTLGLTANINAKMVEGSIYGQISLTKELDSQLITQDYNCILAEIRR